MKGMKAGSGRLGPGPGAPSPGGDLVAIHNQALSNRIASVVRRCHIVYIYVHVYIYIHISLYEYIYIYIYIYRHVHVHIHIHIYRKFKGHVTGEQQIMQHPCDFVTNYWLDFRILE